MSQLLYSAPPHLHSGDSTARRHLIWNLSLLPIAIGALFAFGGAAFSIMTTSILGSLLGQLAGRAILREKSIWPDGRAVLIGFITAFLFTPAVSPWAAFLATFLGTLIAQEFYGGLGASIFHPSLAGYALAQIFSKSAEAAPAGSAFLFELAERARLRLEVTDFLWGVRSGALGEASLAMAIISALILLRFRMIKFFQPALFLAGVTVAALLFRTDLIAELFLGSTFTVAFFIITDYETTPLSKVGKYFYAAICGFGVVMFRHFTGRTDSALYGLLILNTISSLLDEWFGRLRRK